MKAWRAVGAAAHAHPLPCAILAMGLDMPCPQNPKAQVYNSHDDHQAKRVTEKGPTTISHWKSLQVVMEPRSKDLATVSIFNITTPRKSEGIIRIPEKGPSCIPLEIVDVVHCLKLWKELLCQCPKLWVEKGRIVCCTRIKSQHEIP
jgi:hypothetical protein